jgi:uncharacterized metal-binding protein YceD (DUF177 family)
MKLIFDPTQFGQLPLTKIQQDQTFDYKLDKECPWVAKLLEELNEDATELSNINKHNNSSFNLQLHLKRKYNASAGEYVLAWGKIDTTFYTECVKTLQTMQEHIEVEFKACFVDLAKEAEEQFAEQDEYYTDGQVWDLHFFEEETIDLQEMLHEVVYLNKNQYPTIEVMQDDDDSTRH